MLSKRLPNRAFNGLDHQVEAANARAEGSPA